MTGPAPAPDTGVDNYLVANGLRFHYRESGSPDARPVVVLHGMMGISREWDTLTGALARDYHVFAVDQRGHGETDWAGAYTAAGMADDIIKIVSSLGLRRVTLIGHSLGAMVALVCAADRPDLVKRLVVIDVAPASLTSAWARNELAPTLRDLGESSYAEPREAVEEWLAGDPLAREPLVRNFVEHSLVPRADGRLVWRFDAAKVGRFITEGVTEDQLWNAIDRITAPTLLIRGEHSELLSREAAEETHRRLANGLLVEIPDGGHDLGVEQPEAVTGAILDFLRS